MFLEAVGGVVDMRIGLMDQGTASSGTVLVTVRPALDLDPPDQEEARPKVCYLGQGPSPLAKIEISVNPLRKINKR